MFNRDKKYWACTPLSVGTLNSVSTSVNGRLHNKIENKHHAEISLIKGVFFWHRNILDCNSACCKPGCAWRPLILGLHSSLPFALSHQRTDTSCCRAHLPFCWVLREDQRVKAAGSETGTRDLLLSAGLVSARDDSSVGSGSAITALYWKPEELLQSLE